MVVLQAERVKETSVYSTDSFEPLFWNRTWPFKSLSVSGSSSLLSPLSDWLSLCQNGRVLTPHAQRFLWFTASSKSLRPQRELHRPSQANNQPSLQQSYSNRSSTTLSIPTANYTSLIHFLFFSPYCNVHHMARNNTKMLTTLVFYFISLYRNQIGLILWPW